MGPKELSLLLSIFWDKSYNNLLYLQVFFSAKITVPPAAYNYKSLLSELLITCLVKLNTKQFF